MENSLYFSSIEIVELYFDHSIHLSNSLDYFPQGNGQVESINQKLVNIMRNLVTDNQKNWHKKLYDVIWKDRLTP